MTHSLILRAALAAGLAAGLLVAVQPAASQAIQGGDNPGQTGLAPQSVTGEEVYNNVCKACHMAGGKGGSNGAGAIPALASNAKLAVPAYPITMVLMGKGAMPWFRDQLSAEQVAAVITYLRTHFGNTYPAPVTAADVAPFMTPPDKE